MRLFIQTRRLNLRPLNRDDAARVALLANDRDVARMTARLPHPYSLSDAEQWIAMHIDSRARGEEFAFAVTTPSLGLIGSCGVGRRAIDAHAPSPFSPEVVDPEVEAWEIGYWLGRPYWGMGFATEAAQAVMDWASVELDAQVFTAGHFHDNPASGKVLRKLGFAPAGWSDAKSLAREHSAPARRYVWPRGALAAKHARELGAHAPH